MEFFKTNLDELDRLLGNVGFPFNSIVLITGNPGTGKTTLAWEITNQAVTIQKSQVAYMSFDEVTENSFERFVTSYERTDLKKYSVIVKKGEDADTSPYGLVIINTPGDEDLSGTSAAEFFQSVLAKARHCGLFVIDGLNALFDKATSYVRATPPTTGREWMAHFRTEFLEAFFKERTSPAIVVITAEGKADRPGLWFESYMADVEICLDYETVTPDERFPTVQEKVLRCQVPKGRGISVQRRSISYDFVPGTNGGLRFFETYPAEGILSLFHENHPQQQFIQNFRAIDVPSFYPRLSVQAFDRTNLFSEYSIRRRAERIPARRPMAVTSLDEYWIRSLDRDSLLTCIELDQLKPYGQPSGGLIRELSPGEKPWIWKSVCDKPCLCAVPHFVNVGLLAFKKSLFDKADNIETLTWEDLERRCMERRDSIGRGTSSFLIEMKTVDSFISTILELLWSHGGGLWTESADSQIPERGPLKLKYAEGSSAGKANAIEALTRLRKWIHELKIVRPFSTVDVRHEAYSDNWLFARHWYSTLVDMFTARNPKTGQRYSALQQSDIGICRLPIPENRRAANKSHYSAWGEWYLGVESASENKALAIELINNLLTPQKIVQLAITGGGLPTVEAFYDEFGDVRCFGTGMSFRKFREQFFADAISRGKSVEYRYLMRHLYAGAMRIVTDGRAEPSKVWNEIEAAIERTDVDFE